MRQVVNGAKGGPLIGHSSCIVRSADICKESYIHREEDADEHEMAVVTEEEDEDTSVIGQEQQLLGHHHLQQRHKHTHPKTKGPRQQIERERRLRREIANSNERRRMQSINQGYMSLKRMLPVGDSGEKLSKAAVLQNAADYMVQLLEERKQLMVRNSELTQAIAAQKHPSDEAVPSRRKRDVTESSDEGISMSYQPVSHESEVVEELRRTVTELRIQLEREAQRRALLEQSYTYSLMAAQAASQQTNAGSEQIPTTVITTPLSPPQSRHGSTDENVTDSCHSPPLHAPAPQQQSQRQQSQQQSFGKASSVASQNLSIIVEAINHLEGDKNRLTASLVDKEADSGISHGESSDEAKSERSISGTPQPPPAHQSAHQSSVLSAAVNQHRLSTSYTQPPLPTLPDQPYCLSSTSAPPPTPTVPPLLYRPTFLSSYLTSQQCASYSNISISQ